MTSHMYPVAVGQRDPAFKYPQDKERFCKWNFPDGYVCTLLRGHSGPHVGHVAGVVCAISEWELPEELRVSEGL